MLQAKAELHSRLPQVWLKVAMLPPQQENDFIHSKGFRGCKRVAAWNFWLIPAYLAVAFLLLWLFHRDRNFSLRRCHPPYWCLLAWWHQSAETPAVVLQCGHSATRYIHSWAQLLCSHPITAYACCWQSGVTFWRALPSACGSNCINGCMLCCWAIASQSNW